MGGRGTVGWGCISKRMRGGFDSPWSFRHAPIANLVDKAAAVLQPTHNGTPSETEVPSSMLVTKEDDLTVFGSDFGIFVARLPR